MQHFFPWFFLRFTFFGVGLSSTLVGGRGGGAQAFKLLFVCFCFQGVSPLRFVSPHPSVSPSQWFLFMHPATEQTDLSHVGEIKRSNPYRHPHCPRWKKATPGLSVHVEPFCRFAALWPQDVGVVYETNRFTNDDSNLDASREAAGWSDNTVLMMLYKWRELF